MGNAVPKAIKARAKTLLKEFPDQFGADFEKNKKMLDSLSLPLNKKLRNKVVGFITRGLKKAGEE
ncbi:MAG: 30S ribosomal protein S17e [Candidatus Diapherotrites archaeon]|nr:30S ribosomal protein S17e [Candidatus Diapherotrites archaeon]